MDSPQVPVDDATSPPVDVLGPTPTAVDAAEAIVLNVLSPSNEVPGGRLTFPRIHLDTKLSQLKLRIRNALQAAPAPERQRLIYRGHALLNADATLRQVLRPQGSTEARSDSYTLHLVLPPGNIAATAIPSPAPPAAQAAPTELPQPPIQTAMPNGIPQMPGAQLPQQVLFQAQAAQMMLQNQLNIIQQQLGGYHHQHQHGHAQAQAHPHPIPGMPAMNMMPNGMQVTYQVHQGQPTQQMPMPPGFGFGLPNAANFQAMMQQQQQMPHPAVAGHQPVAVPGQPTTSQPGAEEIEAHGQENAGTMNTGDSNESHTTGQSPMTTRIQETIGPQGQRIRTVVRESVNMTLSRHGTPISANQPATTGHAGSLPSATASPIPFLAARIGTSSPRPAQTPTSSQQPPQIHAHPLRQTPMPFMMPPTMPAAPAAPATTMAWVLSSPNGPEALLFAPGHGYFSSSSHPISTTFNPTRTSRRGPVLSTVHPPNLPTGAQSDAASSQPGQAPAPQALARLPHPNAVPAAQAAEENEFLNFIVSRGWLFLRLYVFTFFISEPNTWRRYVLLAVATFVCMLPRDNFLQRGMAQIRRHIDTLIGPPAPPARDGPTAPAQADAGGAAATETVQRAGDMTPAENAARLLAEHEARNPNMIRDVLFRVERAVAMFLASLVPGVGERHVRAREDQRREAERLENERRTREEAEGAQQAEGTESTTVGGAEAGSTAVQTRDDTREARERTTQIAAIEAGA